MLSYTKLILDNLSLRAIRLDRLWMPKRCVDYHNLSPHVIGLAASGWQKDVRMTIICLRMSSGSLPLNDKKVQNDHNLSLRATGLDRLWMAKRCADDHNFSAHVIGLAACR